MKEINTGQPSAVQSAGKCTPIIAVHSFGILVGKKDFGIFLWLKYLCQFPQGWRWEVRGPVSPPGRQVQERKQSLVPEASGSSLASLLRFGALRQMFGAHLQLSFHIGSAQKGGGAGLVFGLRVPKSRARPRPEAWGRASMVLCLPGGPRRSCYLTLALTYLQSQIPGRHRATQKALPYLPGTLLGRESRG